MIRVGIDARLLSEPVSGISRYTAELSKQLIKYPARFYLYSARPIDSDRWEHDNVTIRSTNCRNRISRMLWSQSYLPYWAGKDQLDVFWSPTHRLPRYLPNTVVRIVTIHDLVWKHAGPTMRPLNRWMEKKLMPESVHLSDRIVAVSFSTSQAIAKEFPAVNHKIRVSYPGVSELPAPLDFQALARFGITRPYFLFVGTLEPRKNLPRLINAFGLLNQDIRQRVRLVIAGGKGWGNVDIGSHIKKMGLSEQVIQLGYVNDAQLSSLYANALFLAMPSIYEGFGLPLIEAMSFGVPVLTSNTSSMPEVAGEAGVLVDPFDEKSIASGLTSLLDKRFSEQLASKALSNARRFCWQQAAKDMWTIFEEAIDVRKRRVV